MGAEGVVAEVAAERELVAVGFGLHPHYLLLLVLRRGGMRQLQTAEPLTSLRW